MKKEYQLTIAYKSVITVDVKAENEQEAKEIALKHFKDVERKTWFTKKSSNCVLQDDTFSVQGCINMDTTWNML